MRRVSALSAVALAFSVSACASMKLDLRSARLVYAVLENPYDPQRDNGPPRVFLRVEFTTDFDFKAHGATIGYLVPCGQPRSHLGGPLGGLTYFEMSDISPFYDAPHPPGQVFTAQFAPGWPKGLFNVTPSDEAPADGVWKVSFMDVVKAQGLCFYVQSGGEIFTSATSPDIRIDGILQAPSAPPRSEAKTK